MRDLRQLSHSVRDDGLWRAEQRIRRTSRRDYHGCVPHSGGSRGPLCCAQGVPCYAQPVSYAGTEAGWVSEATVAREWVCSGCFQSRRRRFVGVVFPFHAAWSSFFFFVDIKKKQFSLFKCNFSCNYFSPPNVMVEKEKPRYGEYPYQTKRNQGMSYGTGSSFQMLLLLTVLLFFCIKN